jgi:HTH-type transcriptional regulator / antitoxin HipB
MQLTPTNLTELAARLKATRKAQGLSRLEAAAVCGVSASFVRDAEATPHTCSLGHLVRLANGLGLSMAVDGLNETAVGGE